MLATPNAGREEVVCSPYYTTHFVHINDKDFY
jgi:hypothetical protein